MGEGLSEYCLDTKIIYIYILLVCLIFGLIREEHDGNYHKTKRKKKEKEEVNDLKLTHSV